jgi:hypothetical protein
MNKDITKLVKLLDKIEEAETDRLFKFPKVKSFVRMCSKNVKLARDIQVILINLREMHI